MERSRRLTHQRSQLELVNTVEQKVALEATKIRVCTRRFGFVLLAGGLLAWQNFAFNNMIMGERMRVFSNDFMQKFDQ
jgi:hypothetical protein